MTSIEHGSQPPKHIKNDDIIKVIRDAQNALASAGLNVVKYRTTIKAQAARIAELEEYVARLERTINRSHHHMNADNKAVALNILRAYITTEKEKGQDERHDDQDVSRSGEARPDDGPATRGKSAIFRECYYDRVRPETLPAFTATARGERYLKLIEELGDDSTTFRDWWRDQLPTHHEYGDHS